jgi:hypothetical protein
MNFLFPAAWGWLGLALPIIALYLIRTQLERRSVSTLLFWEQIKTQSYNSALWRKLRRWLSLLLQLLFLALVAFALTQPLAPWQTAEPARTVFVLDPSASMSAKDGGQTRWDQAVAGLGQRIRQMRAFDRAAILIATDPPQVLSGWTASRRALLEALQSAQPLAGQASLLPALALAENLRATQPNSSIQLLTDGVGKDAGEVPANVEVVLYGEAAPNVGISHFSARRSFSSPGEVRLALEVMSRAKEKLEGTVELLRGGQLVDVQAVALEPGGQWQREWDLRAGGAEEFQAKLIGFPADALAADDTAQVKVAAVQTVRVVLVSQANPYLEAALGSLPLVEWARVETLAGFPDPGALYVFNRTAAPEGFESANSILINPPTAGFWGKPVGTVERPLVSEVSKDEPLMRHTGFANVSLDAAAKWEKPSVAQVFAESFGEPLIYGQWNDRHRWALLAFDLEGSDFVLRTAFPILLGNAVESLRPSKSVSPSTAPGRVESALEPTVAKENRAGTAPPVAKWGLAFPLWWWALAAACLWLVGEWWLYTRRVTE